MQDTFYNRLDFYRMLEAGVTSLSEVAIMYKTTLRTIQRWKKQYDNSRGPFGSIEDVKIPDGAINLHFVSPPNERHEVVSQKDVPPTFELAEQTCRGDRSEIISAVRQAALDGNIQAAKLLLSEYQSDDHDGDEILTVEKAIELLREWNNETPQTEIPVAAVPVASDP